MNNPKLFAPKKELDNARFSEFIILLSFAKDQEMRTSDIWEATKELYYYSHPDFTNQTINMGAMKRHISRAISEGYLTMTGKRSTTRYIRTDLLKNKLPTTFRA